MIVLLGALVAALTIGVIILTGNLRRTRLALTEAQLQNRETLRRLEKQQQHVELLTPLRSLSEVAYNALLLIDRSRSILHMNGAARELFKQPNDGRNIGTVMSVTRSHEIDDLIRLTLEDIESQYEEQIELRGCTYRVRTLHIQSDERSYIALSMEDVSELQRLGRARREFVANISHELRTPITSIRLLVDTLLRGKLTNSDEDRSTLHKIAAETEVLHQMAQELLDLSMIESGRAEFMLRTVALKEIIDTAVNLFTERANRKKLAISAEVTEDITVLADREQLRRVVSNLLHNAIKFTPREGRIMVTAQQDGEWVTIAVTDTGPGIPPQARERIFERFYRADRARHSEGTGLGLAIAKHIVNAHGGEIWAEEPPSPPGARICFRVPGG